MTPNARRVAIGGCFAVLAYPIWRISAALPPFGRPTAQYGPLVNAIAPAARNVSNMVSAVNFDFRGVDTVGEEFMLLCAVTGAVLILRGARGEDVLAKAQRVRGRPNDRRTPAVVVGGRAFGTVILLFGLYMCLHATVTPGGGFQGGAIAASGLALAYFSDGYGAWRRLVRSQALGALEGVGALIFACSGFWPMAHGANYLTNDLPLGDYRNLFSGGLMIVENAGVAIAVIGGFALLFLEFLEETRSLSQDSDE